MWARKDGIIPYGAYYPMGAVEQMMPQYPIAAGVPPAVVPIHPDGSVVQPVVGADPQQAGVVQLGQIRPQDAIYNSQAQQEAQQITTTESEVVAPSLSSAPSTIPPSSEQPQNDNNTKHTSSVSQSANVVNIQQNSGEYADNSKEEEKRNNSNVAFSSDRSERRNELNNTNTEEGSNEMKNELSRMERSNSNQNSKNKKK